MKLASLIFAVCLIPITAHADQDAKELLDANTLLKLYDTASLADKKLTVNIIAATQTGMAFVNSFLKITRKEIPFYCPPGKVSLTGEQMLDMIRRQVKDHPVDGTKLYQLVMLNALQEVFPCK
jgi:hypothetical protein